MNKPFCTSHQALSGGVGESESESSSSRSDGA